MCFQYLSGMHSNNQEESMIELKEVTKETA